MEIGHGRRYKWNKNVIITAISGWQYMGVYHTVYIFLKFSKMKSKNNNNNKRSSKHVENYKKENELHKKETGVPGLLS